MGTLDLAQDLKFRQLAFDWLATNSANGSRSLTRQDIEAFQGNVPEARHRLMNQEGIWKPASLVATLSVTSGLTNSRHNPYVDRVTEGGLVEYAFTEAPKKQYQNDGLRLASTHGLPIIYFRAVRKSVFDAYFPVSVVGIDEDRRVALLDLAGPLEPYGRIDVDVAPRLGEIEVKYRGQVVKRRLHQRDFRSNVMFAYTSRCSVCSLGHAQLLDAAHILADSRGGLPEISNGLALCKIHHAAYDSNIMGVDSDHRVHVREDILQEAGGPVLEHGFQKRHRELLRVIPSNKEFSPNREYLAARFEEFRSAT
ncbi:HNH endonuclease [Nesterenkonia sp. Act20]|uniref:HNH endonuclease n=1 Tax=Nesterenkonia sp. Act20 TaxID=1483432 RepID=UPI001C4732BA|nr:HNH endonuclease [Nesterenkonia sp. Act20]